MLQLRGPGGVKGRLFAQHLDLGERLGEPFPQEVNVSLWIHLLEGGVASPGLSHRSTPLLNWRPRIELMFSSSQGRRRVVDCRRESLRLSQALPRRPHPVDDNRKAVPDPSSGSSAPLHAGDISRVVNLLAGSLDPAATLDGLVAIAAEVLRVEHAAVLQKDGAHFRIAAARGIDGLSDTPVASTLAHEVLTSGLAQRRSDLRGTDSTTLILLNGGREARSVVVVPIATGSGPVGLIEALSPEVDAFSPDDEALLSSLAQAAALAWQNASEYQAARHRERLATAGAALTAAVTRGLPMEQVLQVTVDSACESVGAAAGAILMPAEGGSPDLVLAAQRNLPPEHTSLLRQLPSASRALPALTFRERRLLKYASAPEANADARLDPALLPGAGAALAAPLIYRGQDFGVLSLFWSGPHAHLDDETESIQGLAVQAASVIADVAGIRRGRETENQLRSTLDNMTDGVILVDREDRIVYANRAAGELTNVNHKPGESLHDMSARLELLGTSGDPLPVPSDLGSLVNIATSETVSTEATIARAGGQATLLVTASPVNTDDGARLGSVWVLRDVTEERERRENLEDLNRQKDEFLTLVSHELKTPLTTVLGYAHVLQRQFAGISEDTDFAFSELVSEANRMSSMINALLELSRIQSARLRERLDLDYVDLNGLVQGRVARRRQRDPRKRIALELPTTERLEALGDHQRLEQVLDNLLDNAVRYNTAGGRILIRLARADDEAVISIADDGPGVPIEEKDFIFEPYSRGMRHESGLGLGLYISREIVQAHDGKIWLDSEPGYGSAFHVALKLVIDEVPIED
ncbi:MAG: GAF domain-containing protein [Dehalococcoidia bacterium]|nr:GAF domain-containing protein [Dehalococcoidia bacterium]